MKEKRLVIGGSLMLGGGIGTIWSALAYRHAHPEMDGEPIPIDVWPLSDWDSADWVLTSLAPFLVGFILVASRVFKAADEHHNHH